jgi:pilus assembly protein TadC
MQSPAIDELESSPTSSPSSPAGRASALKRAGATVGLVVLTALTFSYLFAYAVTNALVSANVLSSWPAGTDPRPRRLLITFASLLTFFLIGAMVARVCNRRRLREIDAMMDETVEEAEEILQREAA